MLIKGLRIAGFKSFVDPVEAPIEPGLTGVVGPNGCGKSNVLESVRWAMGAASAKALRADDMDSVIFSGSAARPAREWAEVTLVIETAQGETLDVSRRIRREMGSTYRINGREARAKDVQLLFADASTGANSPAFVRQGQVSELIAAKPENRRRVLEEAAGISGLHARRHEADLKLSAALTNLERLDEITAEIEAQAAGLKRQARQAARLRALAVEMRKLEALMHLRRIDHANGLAMGLRTEAEAALRAEADAVAQVSAAERAAADAEDGLPGLREEELVADAVLRRIEASQALLDRDLADANAVIARLEAQSGARHDDLAREQDRARDAHATLAALQAELDTLTRDADADTLAALQASADAANAHAESAEARWRLAAEQALAAQSARDAAMRAASDARARVAQLSTQAEQLARDIATARLKMPQLAPLETGLATAQRDLATAVTHHAASDAALQEAEAALSAAREPASAANAALSALRADLAALTASLGDARGAKTGLLDACTVAEGYERALAAALGDDADAAWITQKPRTPPALPRGVRPLTDYVQAPDALAVRLAWCAVLDADDADGAAMIPLLGPGVRLVSRAGDLWRWDGLSRVAGAPGPAALRLERRNRRTALAKKEPALAKRAEEAQAALLSAQTAKDAARNAFDAVTKMRASAQAKANAAQVALDGARASAHKASEALAALTARAAAVDAQRKDADATVLSAEAAVTAAPTPDPTAQDTAKAEADAARARAAEANAALAIGVRAKAARDQRITQAHSESTAWRKRENDALARIVALQHDIQSGESALAEARAKPATLEEMRGKIAEELAAARTRASAARDAVAVRDRVMREAAAAARAAQNQRASASEARAAAIARADAGQARVAELIQAARDALGLEPDGLATAAGALMDSALARADIGEIERKYDRMRAERDSAGPVNLRADEELEEVETRLSTLATERADVAAAVAKLRSGVARINAEARQRLNAAFTQINANFAMLFTTLFEGGEARLALTDSDDPLACGLEIYASPPGKRLTTLSLMSGGEQALTATALIFAVFLANPAPLCVLDEVDAPLDDANVDRFCRMLERMRDTTRTRFLVITHNPITMSRMDRLFGVTMPDAGASQIVSVDLAAAKALAA